MGTSSDSAERSATAPNTPAPQAELGMYPFAGVRWAWDTIWHAVADRVAWLPPKLAHSGDIHAAWDDQSVIVNQVCGWPFGAYHQDTMTVIGTFSLALPPTVWDPPGTADETEPGYYRTVLVARQDRPLVDLVADQVTVAINSADSLSGAHSLAAATVGADIAWPGPVVTTGSHVESLRAVGSGRAELASIDSWTLALAVAEEPEIVDGLYRVGFGPLVPTPPITVRTRLGSERIAEVHDAFAAALDDPATETSRAALFISGWVDHDDATYQQTQAVASFPT